MGLPEHVAAPVVPTVSTPRPYFSEQNAPAVFVVRERDADTRALGNQFVLGFLPVTRLYLQHGMKQYLQELLLEVLLEDGYSPYLVSADLSAMSALGARQVLELGDSTVSVNAYDLIFSRRLSVSGAVALQRLETNGKESESRQQVTETRYWKHGHAPLLEELLLRGGKRALRQATEDLLGKASSRQRPTGSSAGANDTVIFALPDYTAADSANVGKQLAASYGFTGLPPFNSAQIGRIFQRGMERGADELGLSSASSLRLHASVPVSAQPTAVWYLSSEILSLELPDTTSSRQPKEMFLSVDFKAHMPGVSTGESFFAAQCAGHIAPNGNDDGFWVVATEEAARQMTQIVLSKLQGRELEKIAKPQESKISCRTHQGGEYAHE